MDKKLIAFDLGSTWAFASNLHGEHPRPYSHTVVGARPEKLSQFTNRLAIARLRQYDAVIFERPFARGQAATRMLWGMAAILEAAAHNEGAAVIDITPAEIKKWATGRGTASKSDMIAAAHCLGYMGGNEHEADAYCLLKMAEATLEIH